jgi:hypothetical protein
MIVITGTSGGSFKTFTVKRTIKHVCTTASFIMQAPYLTASHKFNVGPDVISLSTAYTEHAVVISDNVTACTVGYTAKFVSKPSALYTPNMTALTSPIKYNSLTRTFDWSAISLLDVGTWKFKLNVYII